MSKDCPSHEQLAALLEPLESKSSASMNRCESGEIEQHVATCPECEERLAKLVSDSGGEWGEYKRLLDTNVGGDTDDASSVDVDLDYLTARLEGLGFDAIRELGRGGMGIVLAAEQPAMKRTVAIKMLLGGNLAGPQRTQRLLYEAQAIGQLNHPNVLKIFDTIDVGGIPGLVLEYAAGGSLADRLAAGPLDSEEAVEIARQIAAGLAAAHRQGILHRDVKPANVLLEQAVLTKAAAEPQTTKPDSGSPTTREPTVKLADFGLAKDPDRSLELTGSLILGTPSYMAPEQIDGRSDDVDSATDVYAVGVVLYEMLTGAAPFRAATAAGLYQLITTQDPVNPRQIQPTIARDLETICLQCLEKDPRARYATADQLLDDLVRVQERRPIAARPPNPMQRLAKWCRRKPASAALVVTAVVALIAVGATWGFFTARLNRVNSELSQKNTTLNETNGELQNVNQQLNTSNQQLQRQQALTDRQLKATKALRQFLLHDLLVKSSPLRNIRAASDTGDAPNEEQPEGEPTIRALVLRAAESLRGEGLEERFPAQPEVQAEVLTALATILEEFGEFELAFELGQRAVEVHPAAGADFDLEHFQNLLSFSVQCSSMGKFEETIEICTHIIEQTKDRDEPRLYLSAMHNLAGSHMMLDKPELAITYSTQALAGYRELLGDRHVNTLHIAATHAQILEELKRYDEAVELLTETLEKMTETLTEKHPRTISTIGKLASVLQSAKEYDRAIPLYRKELQLYEQHQGKDHPRTLFSKADLGCALAASGEVEAGVALMKEAQQQLTERVGADHHFVVAVGKEISKYSAAADDE